MRHPQGYLLGAICAIANEPRQWSPEDVEVLRDLARLVDAEIAAIHRTVGHSPARLTRESLVLDLMTDAVIVTDGKGRVIEWNRAAEQVFGYPRDQVLGRPRTKFQHPGDAVRLGPELVAALRTHGRWSGRTAKSAWWRQKPSRCVARTGERSPA